MWQPRRARVDPVVIEHNNNNDNNNTNNSNNNYNNNNARARVDPVVIEPAVQIKPPPAAAAAAAGRRLGPRRRWAHLSVRPGSGLARRGARAPRPVDEAGAAAGPRLVVPTTEDNEPDAKRGRVPVARFSFKVA